MSLPAALSLWAGAARATNDCTDSSWISHATIFDGDLAGFKCADAGLTAVSGVQLHVMQDSEHPEPDAAAISSLVVSSAKAALDKYRSVGSAIAFHDVNVVLSPYQGEDGVQAGATSDLQNECLVVVFTGGPSVKDLTTRAKELPNNIAHELFHCVQYWNDAQQVKADGFKWWAEGSAEAMSQLVFDNQEHYKTRTEDFEASPLPLTKQVYPPYVFFAWLLQDRGPAAIFPFMAAMPTGSGEEVQQAALLSQVPPEQLNRFAEAFVDGRIQTPQGWMLPAPPSAYRVQTFKVGGPDTLSWPVPTPTDGGLGGPESLPFSVQWGEARFEGGVYALTAQDDLTPLSHFSQVPGVWGDKPTRVGAPCGNPSPLRFAAFNNQSSPVHFVLQAKRDASVVSGPLPDHDACLAGSWVLDATAVENRVNAAVGDPNPPAVVNGDVSLAMPSDGKALVYKFSDYDMGVGFDSPAATLIDLAITGQVNGSWSSSNASHTLRMCPDSSTVVAKTTVQVFTPQGTVESVTSLTSSDLIDTSYTCTPTQLTLTVPGQAAGSGGTTVYKRPGTPDSPATGTTAGAGAQKSKGCTSAPGGLGLLAVLGLRRRRA
jgi:hypothetical protein